MFYLPVVIIFKSNRLEASTMNEKTLSQKLDEAESDLARLRTDLERAILPSVDSDLEKIFAQLSLHDFEHMQSFLQTDLENIPVPQFLNYKEFKTLFPLLPCDNNFHFFFPSCLFEKKKRKTHLKHTAAKSLFPKEGGVIKICGPYSVLPEDFFFWWWSDLARFRADLERVILPSADSESSEKIFAQLSLDDFEHMQSFLQIALENIPVPQFWKKYFLFYKKTLFLSLFLFCVFLNKD
jgi:hypothetical protein